MSTHDHIWELITDFVKRRLSDQDASTVEGHLRECAQCRDWADECRRLDEDLDALTVFESATHPEVELLGQFATSDATITAEESASIELHLVTCESCRKTVDLARELAAAPPEPTSRRQRPTAAGSSAWERVRQLLARPAVAYFIAAAAITVSLWPGTGLREFFQLGSEKSRVERVYTLMEQTRNLTTASAIPTIEAAGENILLRIDLRVTAGSSYAVAIQSEDRNGILHENLSATELSQESVIVRLGSDIASGRYTAVIIETRPSGEIRHVYHPFAIIR